MVSRLQRLRAARGPCRWDDVCAVHVPWAQAQEALRTRLDETTFQDLAEIDAAIEAGTYQVPAGVRATKDR